MPTCHLTKRWGEGVQNPQHSDLVAALNELNKKDAEHPDCWLNTEEGWSLSVFESGLVVLENIETGEGPWHMRSVSRESALELWQLLQANEMASLHAKPWVSGYGNT